MREILPLKFYLILGVICNKPSFQPERRGVPTNLLISAQKLGYCVCKSFLFFDVVVVCSLILWTVSFLNYRVYYKLSHQRMVPAQLLM